MIMKTLTKMNSIAKEQPVHVDVMMNLTIVSTHRHVSDVITNTLGADIAILPLYVLNARTNSQIDTCHAVTQ